jgi:hypothetical protein
MQEIRATKNNGRASNQGCCAPRQGPLAREDGREKRFEHSGEQLHTQAGRNRKRDLRDENSNPRSS